MKVISSEIGFVLSFENPGQIRTHIKNLKGLLTHIKNTGVKPPYLLGIFSNYVPYEKADELLSSIKPDPVEAKVER